MKPGAALLACALTLGGCGSDCELVSCPNRTDVSFSYCHTQNNGCFFRGGADKFACLSCDDCDGAHQTVLYWCGQQPTFAEPVPGESCSAMSCRTPPGRYRFCATPDASACEYVGGDGTRFSCASCDECTVAAGKITNWCNGAR